MPSGLALLDEPDAISLGEGECGPSFGLAGVGKNLANNRSKMGRSLADLTRQAARDSRKTGRSTPSTVTA